MPRKGKSQDSSPYEGIRSRWEAACVGQFLRLFQCKFNFSFVTAQEIEAGLVDTDSFLIADICARLLRFLTGNNGILISNFEDHLNRETEKGGLGARSWEGSTPEERVVLVKWLADHVLYEKNEELKEHLDECWTPDDMRGLCAGQDAFNNVYWYFDDLRLYRENCVKKSSRGDWECVCVTYQEWILFLKQYRKTTNIQERELYLYLRDQLFPLIERQLKDLNHQRKTICILPSNDELLRREEEELLPLTMIKENKETNKNKKIKTEPPETSLKDDTGGGGPTINTTTVLLNGEATTIHHNNCDNVNSSVPSLPNCSVTVTPVNRVLPPLASSANNTNNSCNNSNSGGLDVKPVLIGCTTKNGPSFGRNSTGPQTSCVSGDNCDGGPDIKLSRSESSIPDSLSHCSNTPKSEDPLARTPNNDFGVPDPCQAMSSMGMGGLSAAPGGMPISDSSSTVVGGGGGMGGTTGVPQPLPSNVINKQPGTMEAQYMQQQSQIFVFSTKLANRGAEAVIHGHFPSIIAFHCAQPGTKKYLDKHPFKVNQFTRQNPAQWFSNIMQSKQKSNMIKGMTSPQINPNNIHPDFQGSQGMPGSPAGMGPCWNQNTGQMMGPCTNMMGNCTGPSPMGPQHPHSGMPNTGKGMMDGSMVSRGPMMNTNGPVGMIGSPSMGPGGSPNMIPRPPSGSDGSMVMNQAQHSPMVMSQAQHSPMVMSQAQHSPMSMNQAQHNHLMNMHPAMINQGGMKVPDENLTPQQRAHREEQLATLRKMQQMLFPEHQMNQMNMENMMAQQGGMMMVNQQGNPMMMPGVQGMVGSPGCLSPQGGMKVGGRGGPMMMGPGGMMPNPGGPMGMNAHVEWLKLQEQFYEERIKKGSIPMGPMGHSPGLPPSPCGGPCGGPCGSGPCGGGSRTMCPSGIRAQGPPPPYHQTQRCSSVPGAMPSPAPPSPGNLTSSLSLPSPRGPSGLNSPISEPSRMYPMPRMPGPSPNSLHNTPMGSPNPTRPMGPSNPGTPIPPHPSPGMGRKEMPEFPGSQPTVVTQQQDSMYGRSNLQSFIPQQQKLTPPHQTSPSTSQSTIQQQVPSTSTSQLTSPPHSIPCGSSCSTSSKEPNLMPVPSPQQIQYLNAFEGQELTIQKQPNTSLRDTDIMSPTLPPTSMDSGLQSNGPDSQGPRISGPNTPLTPSSSNDALPPRYAGPHTPHTPGSENTRFPVPSPQMASGTGFATTGPATPHTPGSCEKGRFHGPSPDMKDPRFTSTSPQTAATPTQSFSSCPSTKMGMSLDLHSPKDNNSPFCTPADNIPLNPNGSKVVPFDPITSMAQMSQQLTSSSPPHPSAMMNSSIATMSMGPGCVPGCVPGGMGPGNPHMVSFNTSLQSMQGMQQMNEMGHCPPSSAAIMMNAAGGNIGPGPQTVNNTYVNATMTIQQMNVHGMSPNNYGQNGPHMGPQGMMGPNGMIPCGGAVTSANSPAIHASPSPKNMNPQMMMVGAPRGNSPGSPFPMGGVMGVQRVMGPTGRMSGRSPGPYNGASVTVKASAPNTIQYLPARTQNSAPGPRGPPCLEFLQRFVPPGDNKGPMQYFPSATGQPGNVTMGTPGGPISIAGHNGPMSIAGHNGPMSMAGHNGPMSMAGHNGPMSMAGHNGPHMTGMMGVPTSMAGMGPMGGMGPVTNGGMSGVMGPNSGGSMPTMNGPMGSAIMGPNGPMSGMNMNGPMGARMNMGPTGMNMGSMGGPNMGSIGGHAMVPRTAGPPTMMRSSNPQQMFSGSAPNMTPEQMYGPMSGGPSQMMPSSGSPVFMGGGNPRGDGSQPLPPSMGQSGGFKASPFMAGPTTADPNYAQQFHNFQQQLYATNTRSQMGGQAQSFFTSK